MMQTETNMKTNIKMYDDGEYSNDLFLNVTTASDSYWYFSSQLAINIDIVPTNATWSQTKAINRTTMAYCELLLKQNSL